MNGPATSAVRGDMVTPSPLWNRTERHDRQLHDPTEVLDSRRERNCQTGVMLLVRTKGGHLVWLSAGWFTARG